MNSSESAETVVKMTLEGVEVAVRLTGKLAEKFGAMLYAKSKEKKSTKGKTNLNNMLKSDSQLQIFPLSKKDLSIFHKEAKRYGVLYTVLVDRKQTKKDGIVDVMVKVEDSAKINRIIERFKISTVDITQIKTEIEKDKVDEMVKDAKERGVEVKSDEERLVDEILSKPVNKEENDSKNVQQAQAGKNSQSVPSSESKKESGVASKPTKPSVRETLKNIRNEIKNRNAPEPVKRQLEKGNEVTFVDTVKKRTTIYRPTKRNMAKGKER